MSGFEWSFSPLDLIDFSVPEDKKDEALEAVKDFVREEMLSTIADGRSPVAGGEWVRSLTPEYKKKKAEESSNLYADLQLSGSLLDEFNDSFEVSGDSIMMSITSEENLGRAEAALTGLYGAHAKSERPRQFMPQGGETLKRDILSKVREILEDYRPADEERASDKLKFDDSGEDDE